MMTWLGFSLQVLARQQSIIIASVVHCPPPLQLPIGPIWACSQKDEAGYLLPGRPEIQLRQAARQLLTQAEQSIELAIPVNPWAGGNTKKHELRLHLRKLDGGNLPQLMLLDGKLRLGQSCDLDLESLALSDGKRQVGPITAQAIKVQGHFVSFGAASAHIEVYGAGALAHQVIKMLSNGPFTVHWEGNASECLLNAQAANVLTREPDGHASVNPANNSHCLVMTHDHALDFKLCAKLAGKDAVRSVGVVGSTRKCRDLQLYLAKQALNQQQLNKVRCPLGGRNTDNLNVSALDIVHEVYSLANANKPT